jgi:hypothetical protein
MPLPGKKRTACLDARYERRPVVGPPYPVPMGTEYRVRDGDTWRTVAKAAGVPVWELIKFNCRTTDPAEVNWWLHHTIQCDTCTADEKNWMFSSGPDVQPIYLPPPPSLRKMDKDARARVVEFTISNGAVQLGILTLDELCNEVGDPLRSGRASYSQIVPPASWEAQKALRIYSWAFGPLPDEAWETEYGSASGYTLGSMLLEGSYLSGLEYPLYASKVHGSKGYLRLAVNREPMNEAEYDDYLKWKRRYDIEAKYSETFRKEFPEPKPVELRYYTQYEMFEWKAAVTGWATAPPAGFVLPD